MLQYFKRSEHHHKTDENPALHGFDGPLYTTSGRDYPLREEVHTAVLLLGIAHNDDINDGDPVGTSEFTENWHKVARQPAGSAYDLSGVRVFTNALIKRIISEDKSAVGVETSDGRVFKAHREVIVRCGALKTPQLLISSGIGPKEQLQDIRVTQIVDSPYVG